MPHTIRTLSDPAELPDWLRAVATGFLRPAEVTKEEVEVRRGAIDLSRTQGAYDDTGRCVATFRTFPQRLTLPGGTAVPASAVTNVTVTATHRRRGLLTRMMASALSSAKERGDACATLIAAEYPIYGRYGFGPATWSTGYTVDIPRTGLDPRQAAPTDGGRIDLVDATEARAIGPAFHERYRTLPTSAGVVDRPPRWWLSSTGGLRYPGDQHQDLFYAVYREASGEVQGIAAYTTDDRWEAKLPQVTATVRELLGATPAAERALWRYLLAQDWVTTLRAGQRAPDDVLPLLLPDPRAARISSHADFLWVRPLDVRRLLEARTYAASGTLTLDVHDPAGLAGGRFRLEASPEGASCAPTHTNADLTMEIGVLGTLCLGDETATRLTTVDRVTEHRPGAAALADTLLRTARRPWCPDIF